MIELIALIAPFFGLILVGCVAALAVRKPPEALGWLNTFVIYIALPALFVKLLAATPVEELVSWGFIVTNLAVTLAIFLTALAAGLLRRARLAEATIQGFAAGYGNIGYMGPGLALLALGEAAAVPVAVIFCFENMMHFALAPALMAAAGTERASLPKLLLGIVSRIALHPFILATAVGVGIAVSGRALPGPVDQFVGYLAQAAAPCALFAMGITLVQRPVRRVPLELCYIVPLKLVAHPLLMYAALTLAGPFDPIWVLTAVLMASLPSATNVFVIAQQYGVWVERASASIFVSTVVSVVTVSVFLYVFRGAG